MTEILDEGPFFHGTIADLQVGNFLIAGYRSNYRPEVVMNHIYFTALADGAGLPLKSQRSSLRATPFRVSMSWSRLEHSRTTRT
jgi:hypothetical protein